MFDLERFVEFIRLTAHQLVSAKPTVGVCLPAQKSYKSEQIEQINNDKKNIWKIWKDLEDFSAKPTEKECVSRHRNPTNQDKSNK